MTTNMASILTFMGGTLFGLAIAVILPKLSRDQNAKIPAAIPTPILVPILAPTPEPTPIPAVEISPPDPKLSVQDRRAQILNTNVYKDQLKIFRRMTNNDKSAAKFTSNYNIQKKFCKTHKQPGHLKAWTQAGFTAFYNSLFTFIPAPTNLFANLGEAREAEDLERDAAETDNEEAVAVGREYQKLLNELNDARALVLASSSAKPGDLKDSLIKLNDWYRKNINSLMTQANTALTTWATKGHDPGENGRMVLWDRVEARMKIKSAITKSGLLPKNKGPIMVGKVKTTAEEMTEKTQAIINNENKLWTHALYLPIAFPVGDKLVNILPDYQLFEWE